jgi:hypothetical protein
MSLRPLTSLALAWGVVLSGCGTESPTEPSTSYDPATNTWKTLAPMPSALSALAGSALRGRLFLVGSTSDGSLKTYAYNPTTNTWTTKAPPLKSTLGSAAAKVFLNGTSRLLDVAGGTTDGDLLDRSELYTP